MDFVQVCGSGSDAVFLKVSHAGWLQVNYVAENDLELLILLPPPPKC